MIAYSRKLIRIVEAWHGETPNENSVDLMRLFQCPAPVEGMFCREFYTILLDLKQEPEALFANIKKGTRYEIHRAGEKDNLIYEYSNARQQHVFDAFCNCYDEFATQKGQPKVNREWLALMAKTGNVIISRMLERTDETLAWHLYYRSLGRPTLLYSASLFRQNQSSSYRNKVGRANRFHHWQDILRFKAEGESLYDFGGWYQGAEDRERLGINKFKEEFGGEIVKNYICERGVTLKGSLFLKLRQRLLGNAI
jgi:hypothetical protein